MESNAIRVIVIVASIICVFSEPEPVKLKEEHLRLPEASQEGLRQSGNGWQDSVPGLPGRDYPNLTSIPVTSFSCVGKTPGGYYADVEARCQVFHVCNTQGSKSSFLCPSGSVFNQRHFVCDWWYDFECEQALELYALNENRNGEGNGEFSSSPPIDEEYSPPVNSNSLTGSNNDLSLASSGYTNNIRDEANSIYDDYASIRTRHEETASAIEQPSTDKQSSNVRLTSNSPGGSHASVIPIGATSTTTLRSIATDKYSENGGRRGGGGESYGTSKNPMAHDYRRQNDARTPSTIANYEEQRRAALYRRKPSQGPDNVPRGFSKQPNDERAKNGSDQSSGFFVNNGLFDELERSKNNNHPLPRENNNYIDNNNYNNEVTYHDNSNFNKNNFNAVNNFNNHENYHQNANNKPLPQENNNYVNNYNNRNNLNNKYYYNNNINNNEERNKNYENRYQKQTTIESNTQNNFNFPEEYYERSTETFKATSSSDFTEDDVDRERQREVDSVDLKRKRPQNRYDHTSSFLIREESSNPYRKNSATNNPYPQNSPDRVNPTSLTPTLTLSQETTTPLAHQQRAERNQYLGKRPTGGLPSGPGNGLPGAGKQLAGSNAVTGKSTLTNEPTSSTTTVSNKPWEQNSYSSSTTYASNGKGFDEDRNSNDDERTWNGDGNANFGVRY